jgi:3',5'-cyclic AMP phosphodiesterase CpdA
VIKIVVTHHPFDLPQTYEGHMLVGRAPRAMERFARCGIDLLLAGHLHVSHSGPTAERYSASGHSAVFVQAGTACSTRERGEANAFNVLRLHRKCIEVETHSTEGGAKFRPLANRQFHRTPAGWAHRLNV